MAFLWLTKPFDPPLRSSCTDTRKCRDNCNAERLRPYKIAVWSNDYQNLTMRLDGAASQQNIPASNLRLIETGCRNDSAQMQDAPQANAIHWFARVWLIEIERSHSPNNVPTDYI